MPVTTPSVALLLATALTIGASATEGPARRRTGLANDALIAPAGSPGSVPDRPAETFAVPATDLLRTFREVISRQPRAQITAFDPAGLRLEAVQRSRVLRFVDAISVETVPLGPSSSTYLLYSRSRLGFFDFGVNRRRVEDWARAVAAELARPAGQEPGAGSPVRGAKESP